MVRAKNCENAPTFVKVIQRKLLDSFPHTVYMVLNWTGNTMYRLWIEQTIKLLDDPNLGKGEAVGGRGWYLWNERW